MIHQSLINAFGIIISMILSFWLGEKVGFMNGWKARIKYDKENGR